MNNILSNMSERKFRYLSALFCFLGDILIVVYLFIVFNDFEKFKQLFAKSLDLMGVSLSQLDPDIIQAQYTIMTSTLKMMLAAFLFIHFIVYIYHIGQKVAATKYIKATLFLTIPTSAIFIYEAWSISQLMAVLFLLQVPTYIFCYKGINYFHLDQQPQKNKELKKSL